MVETPWILSNSIVSQIVLPFVLVFVLIFAILEKAKILGEEKRQINAIVSFVIAAIFVTFSQAVGMVINLMPFLAVFAVIILVFFVLYGFVASGKEGLSIPNGVKIAGGILIFIGLIIAVAVVTGAWDILSGWFTGANSNTIISTVIFLVVIGGAIALVLSTGKKSGSSGS